MGTGLENREQCVPPAVEQVHFCRTSDCPRPPKHDADAFLDFHAANRAARYTNRFLMLAIVAAVCLYASKLFAIGFAICFSCGLVAGLAVLAYWIITARRFVRRLDKDNVPDAPPPGARLQCIGSPSDLPQAVNLESVPFEPHVYHISFAAILVMQATSLFWMAHMVLQFARMSNPLAMVSAATLLVGAVVMVTYKFRPVYFRISPGRLEVLRYGFLSRRAVKVERYDLRKSRIVADLLRKRVTVYEGPASGRVCYLWLMPDRKAAMLMFFLAAVSTYETPELSDEVL